MVELFKRLSLDPVREALMGVCSDEEFGLLGPKSPLVLWFRFFISNVTTMMAMTINKTNKMIPAITPPIMPPIGAAVCVWVGRS